MATGDRARPSWRRTPARVIKLFKAQLYNAKQLYAKMLCDVEFNAVLEQVLWDTILQLDEVMEFKQLMQTHLEACPEDAALSDIMLDAECQPAQHVEEGDAPPAQRPLQQLQDQELPSGADSGSEVAAAPGRFVTSLLRKVEPSTVQQVLSWQVQDWNAYLRNAAQQLSILLQLTTGASAGYYAAQTDMHAVPHLDVADQQLCQAVEHTVTQGLIGAIYADRVGQQLGQCTAINQITLQQEVPPQHHWQHVLQQLQLTDSQLLQLAAGHRLFVRLCRDLQAAQLAVADIVDTPNSCSLQVLATAIRDGDTSAPATAAASAGTTATAAAFAAGVGARHRTRAQMQPAVGAAAAADTTPAGSTATARAASSGPPARSASVNGAESSGSEGGPAAMPDSKRGAASGVTPAAGSASAGGSSTSGSTDADGAGIAAADPTMSMTRLLCMLTQATSLLHFLMINSLSHQQIARLVVVSFPFCPRPAPIMEAAHEALVSGARHMGSDDQHAAGAGGCGSSPAPQTLTHSQQRSCLLQQQVQRWHAKCAKQ